MNIKFSDLTLIGKLLLIPTLAVMAAAGYFGAPLFINRAGEGLDKSVVGDLGVLLILPLAAGALGSGVLFFALSSGLLRVLGLRVFQSPTLPDPRPVREADTHLAPEEVQLGLLNIKLSDLPLIVKLLLIPTVAVTAVAAYLTPLFKLYVGPGAGILFFALSASLLRVLGLIQPSLPLRELHLASRKTETGGDDSLKDIADGDSEAAQADPTDAEAIFVRGNAPKRKSAHEATAGRRFDPDSLRIRTGFGLEGGPKPQLDQDFEYDRLIGGRYSLTMRIGNGGNGEVWFGKVIDGNIPKAIKITCRTVESDETRSEQRSLEIMTKHNHPYLLHIDDFFAEQGRLIVVMEFADGGSLRDALEKARNETGGGLPVENLLVDMSHMAAALDYLHKEGVLHRGVKPDNILLVGGMAKLADSRLALLAANRQPTKSHFTGSAPYSSPETWMGRVTSKSDQYSLAITYAELRLGRRVFEGNSILEIIVANVQSKPDLNPIPDAEQQVLRRALAKNPDDRFATCSEFIKALEVAVVRPENLFEQR